MNYCEHQGKKCRFEFLLQYDVNEDGYLDTNEIKELLRNGQADNIDKNVVKKIFLLADEVSNSDT
jgi:Ca2+-binding EF-hand superfamily protein